MGEETALRAAILYRAEAEMILFDLLNVGSKRTNQTFLEDPDILYRMRGPLWKEGGGLDPETVRLNLIKKSTGPEETVDIQPPAVDSKEFKEVARDASKLPLRHRQLLAESMGFGEKRNSHRPSEIQIPVIVPDEDSERTYHAGHFTTIRDFPLKSKMGAWT